MSLDDPPVIEKELDSTFARQLLGLATATYCHRVLEGEGKQSNFALVPKEQATVSAPGLPEHQMEI